MTDVTWIGERALRRTFEGDTIEANARARALGATVRGLPDVEDAIPGACTLTVVLKHGAQAPPDLLEQMQTDRVPDADETGRTHTIPVTYDGDDLRATAERIDISIADLITLHTRATYTVAFLGFAPGFAYLLGLPEELRVPRLATPRIRVPAGSVAIAGEFAAIYPRATPGGWNLLGTTETAMFDVERAVPLLSPGDTVRFVEA